MKRIATVLLALLTMAGPAQAQVTISPHVGKLLQEAQNMTKQGNWKGAAAKVNEADGQANKTAADTQVINQMRNYIKVASVPVDPTQPQCTSARMGVTKCDGRQVQP